jgi:hypothetical protein
MTSPTDKHNKRAAAKAIKAGKARKNKVRRLTKWPKKLA